jgi:nickel-dependent lactate racemase
MNQISLAYGNRAITFAFDQNRFQIITRDEGSQGVLSDAEIGSALDSPIASAPIEDVIAPGETVLIVVSDATRATGSAQLVNILVRRLIQFGTSPSQIAIIFATGIHRPVTPQEKLELLTSFIVQRIRVLEHNASDPELMIHVGVTELDTPVMVNKALREFDHVIITGGIGFHYFAGFTGGRKSICPGLGSTKTIESTHMLALDFDKGGRRAGVGTGLLDGNAVHEECERIAAIVEPAFAINTVVDDNGRLVRIYAGHWREAHRTACLEYLSTHSVAIAGKRDLVIAGCGGLPYDINLIQAHKSLDMASYACREGGTIILLAECRDGLGRDDFLKWFQERDSRALEERLRHGYEVNGQTAWALLTKAERFRIVLISELPADEVRLMRMIPCSSMDEALAVAGESVEGFIMSRGSAWLPVTRR